MKALFHVVIYTFFCSSSFSQTTAQEPAYKRLPAIPPFTIALAVDSVSFSKENVRGKRPVLIMVFSPDCSHCIEATHDLVANIQKFKKVEIILASSLSMASVNTFYAENKLSMYSNIHVGYDRNNFLGSFYEVLSFPSIFLYDKKGKFKEDFTDHYKFEHIENLCKTILQNAGSTLLRCQHIL
ncbi:MAG: peroxiredoxin family protein [Ferruginibacter sp.]